MKNILLWITWVPIRKLALHVSEKQLEWFSRFIGRTAYLCLNHRRSVLNDEYRQMFPEKTPGQVNTIVRNYFKLRSLIELEETLCAKLDKNNIEQTISLTNHDYLTRSLAKGKGVILATFHFGPHLQIMPALGLREFKVNQVAVKWEGERKNTTALPPSGYIAKKLFQARLKHSGANLSSNIIPLENKSSPRPLFRCLAKNEILIIALDGREVGNIVNVPFFHHDSYRFAAGPINLAIRTGSPIHPVFVVKHGAGKNELIIEKPIDLEPFNDKQAAIDNCLKKAVKVFERYVRRYPCHYGNEIFHEKLKKVTANISN